MTIALVQLSTMSLVSCTGSRGRCASDVGGRRLVVYAEVRVCIIASDSDVGYIMYLMCRSVALRIRRNWMEVRGQVGDELAWVVMLP